LTANICRNAAAIAFRLGGRITIGTPYRPQNVYRNGVPVRSGTTTPLFVALDSAYRLAAKIQVTLENCRLEGAEFLLARILRWPAARLGAARCPTER